MVSSVITVIYWSLSFATGVTFQDLEGLLGNTVLYLTCSTICFFGFLFVLFFVPETKGKSAEEIALYFGGSPPTSCKTSPNTAIRNKKEASGVCMDQGLDLEMGGGGYKNFVDKPGVHDIGLDNPAFDKEFDVQSENDDGVRFSKKNTL
jgi:hypothetical protein